MKKLLPFILCLLLVSSVNAGQLRVLSPFISSTTCAAPAWYNQTGITSSTGSDGNVVWAWDAGDGVTAYNNTCGTITGSQNGGELTTYDNHDVFIIDAVSEYITWTQTSDQYADLGADQTMCMQVSLSATSTNTAYIFTIKGSGSTPYASIKAYGSNTKFLAAWSPNSATVYDTNVLSVDTWYTNSYSFEGSQAGSSGDHAKWDDTTWDDDADELGTAASGAVNIILGTYTTGDPNGTDIRVSKLAIIDKYKADCTELTGW